MQFRQSMYDFPLKVKTGEKNPTWGLHRYKQGLRFVPSDDEGFTLQSDKRRLLYKGRKRSHRFTVLGDTAFEYDCILGREPDTNTISLVMEGAENFDFFRQPDFVPDPFLKGSYAVYKKETLIGEGTGKLCHIHRPEIIDAQGRRCWGDLSIVGNRLNITIPEKWLGEATYPVIVDPTIGTTTVGSQYKYDGISLYFELSIPVNKFLVSDTINGLCTAYVYVNSDDYDAGGRPVFYSDNGDKPNTRKSMNEGFIDLRVTGGKPAGWRSATFNSNSSIVSGSNIWFGVFSEYYWFPRFDYGLKCYSDFWDAYDSIPNTYPIYDVNGYENFRLSMYFTYTSAQNYVRTLTQGIAISDNRIITGNYKRSFQETAVANSLIGKYASLCRNIQETVKGTANNFIVVTFFRSLLETIKTTDIIYRLGNYYRGLFDTAKAESEAKAGWAYFTKITDSVRAVGLVFRGLLLFVRIISGVFIRDYLLRRFLRAKTELEIKSCICRELTLESRIN